MIIVTNGTEKLIFDDEDLIPVRNHFNKDFEIYAIKLKYDYWGTHFILLKKENKPTYISIIKCLNDDFEGAKEKEYLNLDKNNKNNILLSKKDFNEFKRLINKMNSKKDYMKETSIEICSVIFSYYIYQEYILEEDFTESVLDLYNRAVFVTNEFKNYRETKIYKDKIFKRTREILKEKYNVENLI